ncbi:UNVERIFIED_CONTAM: Retrovirus-related Pol polyprotein from transposon TNT 1-94 [Sesamum radiatum]|uniref:Retrovirus-related Pol polyprotein from transposon TNT 1-94 n=2 Tax=Sesamum TaxID=4181 RepID=A0AAW2JVV3_SESRA
MKGVLIQQKVFKAIDGKYADTVSDDKKLENDEYAYSSIILNLSDSVIRKVGKQESAKELWKKLEELYTETSLPSKLFLLENFFKYKLDLSKNIDENIDDFTKLIQDIKLTGDKNIDDYSPIVLLNAIPETYGNVKAAIKYGRDNVNLETVVSGLKNCRKPKKNDSKDTANVADSDEVYMICDVNSVSSSLNINEWLIDSGCTYHMTPFREILTNYKSEKLGSVSMANAKICDVYGHGDVCLIFENGFKLTLKNVRHVPDLAHNLISCSALEEEGLEGKWGKGVMKIMKGSLTVFKADRKRNLYICSVKYECHTAFVSKTTTSDLWHKRLGHISMKGLDFLHKNGILKEKPVEFDFCDECVLGKQRKVHFPSSPSPKPTSSVCILDYVHADVWGPSNIETHGGNRYFLSVIDNFSRKVFVFLMKHKSEAFEKFRNWKTLVENQTGQKLKALRTDNGLEFCNQNFSDLCKEFGIKRHKTTPDTPQQNGVAERMNKTPLNKVRCLLISSGLPKIFWGEALLTAAYLINRSPSVPLSGKIPECIWTDSDVNLSSLRIFGCSAFALSHGDKLDPRSQKCVFIGYPDGVKGYRLWLRSQPGFKVLISRDVIFNESEFPCLSKTPKKIEDYNIESTFNKVEKPIEDNQQGEENRVETETENENLETSDNLNHYLLARDRERREPRIPAKLRDFQLALNTKNLEEPTSYNEALKTPESEKWLLASPSVTLIAELQNSLCKNFEMKNLGNAKKILGMTIERDRKNFTIFLNQKSYVKSVLEKFSMTNSKSASVPLAAHFQLCKDQSPKTDSEKAKMEKIPYSNAIGSVMYLMVSTRPDIAYAVSCLSRFMSNPGTTHWEALKWLFRYLNGSNNSGIKFSKCSEGVKLMGYVDSNYANDRDSRRSTTSYVFTLCGACISWKSQLQNIVALSTTEAEYIAITEAFKEALWLEGFVTPGPRSSFGYDDHLRSATFGFGPIGDC